MPGQFLTSPISPDIDVHPQHRLRLCSSLGLAQVKNGARYGFLKAANPAQWGLPDALVQRIAQWTALWQTCAAELPPMRGPEYCRTFDLSAFNAEAMCLGQVIANALPDGWTLVYSPLVRMAVEHASRLREETDPEYFAFRHMRSSACSDHGAKEQETADMRWVYVRGDYASSGLWERGGEGMLPEDLPISHALHGRLATWADRYDSLDDGWSSRWEDTPAFFRAQDAALAAYAAEGRDIAHAIKGELPDWTVLYLDAAKFRQHALLDKYVFEISGE